jgi:N utilization substance protein B
MVPADEIIERNPETNEYARQLTELVETHRDRIDEVLATYAHQWPVSRMPAVDRAITRVAVAELLFIPEVNSAVVVSEAVEIATLLSTDDSGKFINGVLGAISAIRERIAG